MKIALIQSNPVAGALRANMEALADAVGEAKALGADLCVAPEMALCGHNAGDLLLRSGFAEECHKELVRAAVKLGQDASLPPLLLGAPITSPVPEGKKLQNCAVLLDKGRMSVIARKVLLPSGGIHNDARYFAPGVACGVLHMQGWRLAVTVGEDVWNDRAFWQGRRNFNRDPVEAFMNADGADGLINLTALPFEQGLPGLHQRMLAHVAVRYRMPVAVANLVGGNDNLIYYGGSMAFDDSGALVARAPAFEEALLLVDMVHKKGNGIARDLPAEEELWQAVVLGARDFGRKCGLGSVVLGLSGGVDSALVAAVAAEAFGPDKVTGLLMPSPYSSPGSIEDSLALARNLGIATHTLPLSPVLEVFERTFGAEFPGGLAGIAEENIQARIRGALLMAHANRFGELLLTTGNKSEAAVGYATLYGDMAGGLAPIGDLYKMQVYALCRWYNEQRSGAIPESILSKAPSAELRPGQKDSDSLPPYDALDPLLYDIIENRAGLDQLLEKGYAPAMTHDVWRLVRQAEFKRRQAPPVLHLSSCSFGGGWHIPIARGGA